ncbi:MAG: prolipoprotein diacylglyceryl transferase [Desulfobacteraceae bacterium]|jgi:phosphatidylglycerol:prolipoprotein diacylglycerol transferase|nr:prolipoprotein diacylglyceryl transferase [Desulfobacteraceae bacterium]
MTAEFWRWWQHLPETIDPVLFEIGGFRIQYYGLMYIVAFALTYLLVRHRLGREARFQAVSLARVQDLLTVMIMGVIVGGRLGYVLFYNPRHYLANPLEIVLPFRFDGGLQFTGIAGMSFHGGLVGVLVAAWIYVRRNGLDYREVADLFVPAVPLGYAFGRLGNFINGELYGRVTAAPIGMHFPLAPGRDLRHPSQLYEAFFEGLVLFAVLWALRRRPLPRGAMLALYLVGYGVVRFALEYFRQPDAHLGFVWMRFSMGQLLCMAMMGAGMGLYAFYRRRDWQ